MQTNFFSSFIFLLFALLILLSIVAIFYLFITAKNRERLALIEKGMNPNLARSDFWLQLGIIIGGVSGGLMLGDLNGGKYGPLVALLLAGAGLVIYNVLKRNKMNRENKI